MQIIIEMNVIKKVTYSGMSWNDPYTTKRGILLTNSISLILVLAITSIFLIRRLAYDHIPMGINLTYWLTGLFSFIVPLILNRIMFHKAAKMTLSYLPIIFLWFLYITQLSLENDFVAISTYDSLRIFLLVLSIIPYLIFDRNNWILLIIGVLPSFMSIVFFEIILRFWEVSILDVGKPEQGYELMQMRTIVAYCILSSGCFTFQFIIHKNDIYNKKSAVTLKEKSDEIEAQNEELKTIQAHLSKVNNDLEKRVQLRTEELKISNEKLLMKNLQLTEYAFYNSHKLRAPVASILGLVGLMENKKATAEDFPIFVEKIKQTTMNLDEVIMEINTILEGNKDVLN